MDMIYDPSTGDYITKPQGSIILPCISDLASLALHTSTLILFKDSLSTHTYTACIIALACMTISTLAAMHIGYGYTIAASHAAYMRVYSSCRLCLALACLMAMLSVACVRYVGVGYVVNGISETMPLWMCIGNAFVAVVCIYMQGKFNNRMRSLTSQLPTGYINAPI